MNSERDRPQDDIETDTQRCISNVTFQPKFSKLRILKNVAVVAFGFMFLFISFDCLAMLQSTVNREQGIGVASQGIIYVFFAISALLLPKYVIKKLGCKLTMWLSLLSYCPYYAANFYPKWITMVPASVIMGLGASLLWGSKCVYLNELALHYSAHIAVNKSSKNNNQPGSEKKSKIESIEYTKNLYIIDGDGRRRSVDCGNHLKSKKVLKHLSSRCSFREMKPSLSNVSKKLSCSLPNVATICVDVISGNVQIHNEKEQLIDETSHVLTQDSNERASTSRELLSHEDSIIRGDLESDDHVLKRSVTERSVKSTDSGFGKSNNSIGTVLETNEIISESNDTPKAVNNMNESVVLKNYEKLDWRNLQPAPTLVTLEEAVEPPEVDMLKTIESTTARFFGFHGMIYMTCQIWSNLLSFFVLQGDENSVDFNSSIPLHCGAYDCNSNVSYFTTEVPGVVTDDTRNMLSGISVALGLLSVLLVILFLDPMEDKEDVTFTFDLLMATFNFMKKRNQMLLAPLAMYTGLTQGFYTSDFTKSYIACAWGAYHIGLVTMCYGSVSALSSTISGYLVKHVGRVPIILTASLVNLADGVMLLIWQPSPQNPVMFFIAAGLYGIYIGIFCSQIRAFYGVLFKDDEEAAFASFYLWSSVGYCIAFSYSNLICTYVKVSIKLAVLLAATLGYTIVELSVARARRVK